MRQARNDSGGDGDGSAGRPVGHSRLVARFAPSHLRSEPIPFQPASSPCPGRNRRSKILHRKNRDPVAPGECGGGALGGRGRVAVLRAASRRVCLPPWRSPFRHGGFLALGAGPAAGPPENCGAPQSTDIPGGGRRATAAVPPAGSPGRSLRRSAAPVLARLAALARPPRGPPVAVTGAHASPVNAAGPRITAPATGPSRNPSARSDIAFR